MLQVQQQLIEGIQSQLESNPPLPEQFSSWADHPVTKHFLNSFRLSALDKEINPWSDTLITDVHMIEGYNKAVNDMEGTIEEYRKVTEGDEDEA